MQYEEAIYIVNKHPKLRGNPFVEALPLRLNEEDFWDATVSEMDIPEDFASFDNETKEEFARDLMDSVEPTSLYYEVYCDLLGSLKTGFKDRNPLEEVTQAWQHQVATGCFTRTKTTAASLAFTGYSGMGKTTLVDSVLSLIPRVIHHKADGPLGYEYNQIVYIKVNIPGNADLKQICLSIIGEIDKVTGTNIKEEYERKVLNTKQCIARLTTLCTTHLIGMIIFDEIQNICLASPNAQKQVFTLFDGLSHDAKVTTVKIGTTKANRLINKEFTNARRLGIPIEWTNYQAHDEDWMLLLERAWDCQLLPNKVELTEEMIELIYTLTQGVAYCLFFLVEQANIIGIRRGYLSFSKELLKEVYQVKFRLIRPALMALRSGKTEAFDDLYHLNTKLDQDSEKLVKELLSIAHKEKLKGSAAKEVLAQVKNYLPEYKLTSTEAITIKRLEQQSALIVSDLEDEDGNWNLPI